MLTIAKEYLDELAPEKEITPFERGSFEPLLRQVASRMDAHGRYLGRRKSGSAKRPPPLDDTLCVTDGWVVFARQRSEDFFVHDLEGLKLAVEQAESLPGPALRLVTEPSGRRTYTSSLVDLAKATFGRAKPPRARINGAVFGCPCKLEAHAFATSSTHGGPRAAQAHPNWIHFRPLNTRYFGYFTRR